MHILKYYIIYIIMLETLVICLIPDFSPSKKNSLHSV